VTKDIKDSPKIVRTVRAMIWIPERYKDTAASGFVGTDERYIDTAVSGFVGIDERYRRYGRKWFCRTVNI
jgi:hypothetical protein